MSRSLICSKEFWNKAGPMRNEFVKAFVRLEDDQSVSKGSQVPGETVLDKHRIAVLPFANISPDPADAYFADGITEELISTISKIGQLQVIARTSVIRYKG
jgi:TolB-like protein